MVVLHYEIVPHDGGWAYKVDDVYSETFATHGDALAAARDAAERQQLADEDTATITYEDPNGRWHEEIVSGDDRPQTEVDDGADAQ
ncbi:DUF2188 domain-containing protein [Consotaella salsifontis]|uniref:DUF2188 domain-containing protein n=1 Tax=Consotaella salsifontis TaxID=1365950 RepID=A0A1T4PW46_9HYPH|nr:DUF2188 domain-containing protein [Consotaella salsifontis]SJZ95743.1 hypothetical protein SAMN05428963_104199 [Consotaella salsifontis]